MLQKKQKQTNKQTKNKAKEAILGLNECLTRRRGCKSQFRAGLWSPDGAYVTYWTEIKADSLVLDAAFARNNHVAGREVREPVGVCLVPLTSLLNSSSVERCCHQKSEITLLDQPVFWQQPSHAGSSPLK